MHSVTINATHLTLIISPHDISLLGVRFIISYGVQTRVRRLTPLRAFQLIPLIIGQSIEVGILRNPHNTRLRRAFIEVSSNIESLLHAMIKTYRKLATPSSQRDIIFLLQPALGIRCSLLQSTLASKTRICLIQELSHTGGIAKHLITLASALSRSLTLGLLLCRVALHADLTLKSLAIRGDL